MIAYVDLIDAPLGWALILYEMGFWWKLSEPQPIADQAKLSGFTMPDGVTLPSWVRTAKEGNRE